MEMCLTGNIVSAEEAKNIGLVNHIYDASKLIKHALDLANEISLKPIEAIISTKKLIKDASKVHKDGLTAERTKFMQLLKTDNGIEGMNAFKERRKPQFKN